MSTDRDFVLIVALTVLALLLRLWHINADLWLDEIMTVTDYMRLSPFEAATTFHAANQHLLNSVLGSISIRIFGESEWAIRLPALLFGVAAIPVFYCLARRVTERREAIVATLFLTFSYHHVWFSQNARGYSAMIFFTVLSSFFLVRWLDKPAGNGSRDWLWFSLCGSLGMLSLLNFAFVLAGQFLIALAVLLTTGERSRIRVLVFCALLILVLTLLGYAATIPAMITYFTTSVEGGGWNNTLSFMRVLARGLTSGLTLLALPVLVFGAVIAFTGWISYLDRKRFIALMLVIPVLFNFTVLGLLHWGAFPRSFLYVLPFGILILVRGAFGVGDWLAGRFGRAQWLVYILPALLLAASVVMLGHNYRFPKQNYTQALAYTRAQAAPDDVIAAVGHMAIGYRSYYGPDLVFPRDARELDILRQAGHRVWVLYSFSWDTRHRLPDIQDLIDTEFQPIHTFPGTLGDGNVYLVVAPPL